MNDLYLYLLTRDNGRLLDTASGFVICASTPKEARAIAAKRAGDELPEAWSDARRSKCRRIGVPTHMTAPGIVLRSFDAS